MQPTGDPTDTAVGRPRKALVGVALAALTVLVGATWAWSYAPFGSPDDDYHLGSIWCAWGESEDFCTILRSEEGQFLVSTPSLRGLMEDCWVNQHDESAACSALDPLEATRADDGQYPPGFYSFMRIFVGDDALRSIMVIRMVSFIIGSCMIAGAILLHRKGDRARLALVSVIALGPLGLFIMASVNPSALSVTGLYAGFLAAYAMLRAPTAVLALRAGAVSALAFTVAAMSRADGSYFAIILATAAGAASLPISRDRLRAVLPSAAGLGAIILALFLTRGWFAEPGMLNTGTVTLGNMFAFSRVTELTELYVGAFAHSTGWLDVDVPSLGHVPRTLAIGAILLFGFWRLQWPRTLGVLLLLGFGAVLPLYLLAPQNLHVGVFVQPRYLLPLILGAAALLSLHRDGAPLPLSRAQAVLLALLATVANSLTMHATIRRFVSGNEIVALDLNRGAEWWWDIPIGPNALWALGTVAFLVLSIGLALLASRTADPEASRSKGSHAVPTEPGPSTAALPAPQA